MSPQDTAHPEGLSPADLLLLGLTQPNLVRLFRDVAAGKAEIVLVLHRRILHDDPAMQRKIIAHVEALGGEVHTVEDDGRIRP